MSINKQISAAEAARQEAAEALSVAEKKLADLYVLRSMEKYGIKPGMRVRNQNKEFVVDEIRPKSWDCKPWLYGRQILKDGKVGDARRNIYGEWEIIDDGTLKTAQDTKL